MGFRHEIRVRYGEVDMQGVAFNAHYLAWVDDAMSRWVDPLGYPSWDLDWDFMVVHSELDWKGGATYGDAVTIDCTVERWGTSSFTVAFELAVGDRSVCRIRTVYVGVRPGTVESMAVPDPFRRHLEA